MTSSLLSTSQILMLQSAFQSGTSSGASSLESSPHTARHWLSVPSTSVISRRLVSRQMKLKRLSFRRTSWTRCWQPRCTPVSSQHVTQHVGKPRAGRSLVMTKYQPRQRAPRKKYQVIAKPNWYDSDKQQVDQHAEEEPVI